MWYRYLFQIPMKSLHALYLDLVEINTCQEYNQTKRIIVTEQRPKLLQIMYKSWRRASYCSKFRRERLLGVFQLQNALHLSSYCEMKLTLTQMLPLNVHLLYWNLMSMWIKQWNESHVYCLHFDMCGAFWVFFPIGVYFISFSVNKKMV